jgi:hypothetical protein
MSLFDQDYKVIQGLQQRLGGLGLLETLTYIESNTAEFSLQELRSFYHIMSEMRQLFAPAAAG